MRRVREADEIGHLRAGVIAGPGDTELWELSASLEDADLPLEISGRGPDLEAAASVLATLAMHFPPQHGATDETGMDEIPRVDPPR